MYTINMYLCLIYLRLTIRRYNQLVALHRLSIVNFRENFQNRKYNINIEKNFPKIEWIIIMEK